MRVSREDVEEPAAVTAGHAGSNLGNWSPKSRGILLYKLNYLYFQR